VLFDNGSDHQTGFRHPPQRSPTMSGMSWDTCPGCP